MMTTANQALFGAGVKKQCTGRYCWLKSLVILGCVLNALATPVFAGLTYTDNGTYATCTGWTGGNPSGDIVIAASYNGKPVTTIGDGAFSASSMSPSQITSVVIPNSVTTIEAHAFEQCIKLTSVTLPTGLTKIGTGAFSGCGLESVTIPGGVTQIFSYAFRGTPWRSLTILPGVARISAYCFSLSGISRVTFPASVTSVEDYAFEQCSQLTSASFMGDAPALGVDPFHWVANGFVVYYKKGAVGFTTPYWRGYHAFPGEAPQITSAPLPGSLTGTPYSYTCTATGGPSPIFSVSAGALPDGLNLSDNGVITGTPTAEGIYTGTIKATNDFPPDATQDFLIDTRSYRVLSAGGVNGATSGAGSYPIGATATLTPTPNPGYVFASWSGDATGTSNPLSVLMNADKTVTATFGPDTGDTDDDGLTNYQEVVEYGTDPTKQDTDNDGVKDKDDGRPLDPAETLDTDHDGIGDNADLDDDGDGLSDEDEINIHGTNPKRADSDGDGLSDPAEIQTHLTNPNLADTDSDGLSDGAEVNTYGTLPKVGDTDGDGFLDGYEVLTGKSPLNILDKPALVAEARTAIEFTFPSALGKTYRIEDSLDLTTWGTVESGITGNGGQIQRFYSTRNVPKRYFRVEEVAP